MIASAWFLLGLWVGGTAGFLLFACLQVSRDCERPKFAARQSAPFGSEPQFHARNARTTRRHVLTYREPVASLLR